MGRFLQFASLATAAVFFLRELNMGAPKMGLRGFHDGAGRASLTATSKCIQLHRNNPWINPWLPQIARAMRTNHDLQFVLQPRGVVAYVLKVAYYFSKMTKPDKGALESRLKSAMSKLKKTSSIKDKLVRLGNAHMEAQQVPVQMAIACLLGSSPNACPIVTFSRTIGEFAFQLPSEKSSKVLTGKLPLSFECDLIPVAACSKDLAVLNPGRHIRSPM